MAEQRQDFDLARATAGLELFADDVPLVAEHVYRSLLERAWRDSAISESERRTLRWAAKVLRLPPETAQDLEGRVARDAFQRALATVLRDGRLTEAETEQLRTMARGLGAELPSLMRSYFANESGGIMQALFAEVVRDGQIEEAEWTSLKRAVSALGFGEQDFLAAVRVQAERFVEHVLADAILDARVSTDEKVLLRWLLDNVIGRWEFKEYVASQLERAEKLQAVAEGRLPSLRTNQLGLRSGEIVHADVPATYYKTRQLKSGPRTDSHEGRLVLTDSRMTFTSATQGVEVNHRRVVEIEPLRGGFELRTGSRGAGSFAVSGEYELITQIYRVAVQRANQIIVSTDGGGANARHIPRDVRQRVWQACGGRCVDCGADQYLEFDHVIPVAKGGSNSDSNVQLLCRRCNLRKSDFI